MPRENKAKNPQFCRFWPQIAECECVRLAICRKLIWRGLGGFGRVVDRLWCHVQFQPILEDDPDRLAEFSRASEFAEVGCHAKCVGSADICGFGRVGQHDHGNRGQLRMFPDPLKNLMPVEFGKMKIQKNQVGQGMGDAIGELAFAAKIMNGGFAVTDMLQVVVDAGPLTRHFDEKRVVTIIFNQQYGLQNERFRVTYRRQFYQQIFAALERAISPANCKRAQISWPQIAREV